MAIFARALVCRVEMSSGLCVCVCVLYIKIHAKKVDFDIII